MLLPPPTRGSLTRTTGISVVLHAVALVLVLVALNRHPVRVVDLPGTASGTHFDLVYLPGSAPVPTPPAKIKVHPAAAAVPPAPSLLPAIAAAPALPLPPRPHLTVTPPAPTPDLASPPAPEATAAAGSDSLGAGDIQIAFTTYSPSPAPDLTLLPHGAQGDVVLDVTIDSSGKVADLAVLRTPGYGIESNVIRTVRTWVFRPATKDGVPIASVQELHFHYGPV